MQVFDDRLQAEPERNAENMPETCRVL